MTRRAGLLCLLAALLTLPAVTTRIYASDEVQYFAFLRSLAFDRDLSFQNEYQHFFDAGAGGAGFHETFLAERFTAAGRRINFGTIGPALLWAPFYAAGHVAAWLTGAPMDGYSAPYVAAVAYGSALYGWAAIWLSTLVAARWFGTRLSPGLAVLAGTPLLFYMYVAPPFSHACATFAVALFLWVWMQVRDRWTLGGVVALGVAGGLMGTMRDQTVLFLVAPAIDFLRAARSTVRGPRSTVGNAESAVGLAVVGTVAALAAYSPHLLASRAINGYVGPHESVGNKMSWSSPHALEVLFSTDHGWFAWTPLALLGLAGLVLMAAGRSRATRPDAAWVGVCALVAVALQVYINGAVESWTVAGAFGQRRFVELTPLLVLGLSALLTVGAATRGLWLAVACCVWWNLGLLLQFGTHRMDRQRLTLRDNAWVTFVELPREAPALVWRYLTDRGSFYRQPRQ